MKRSNFRSRWIAVSIGMLLLATASPATYAQPSDASAPMAKPDVAQQKKEQRAERKAQRKAKKAAENAKMDASAAKALGASR
jgi:hypothetical protein